MDKPDRLLELIGLQQEGRLDDAGWAELNALFAQDMEALECYRQHMELHAALHLAYDGHNLLEDMPSAGETETATASRHEIATPRRGLLALAIVGTGLALVLMFALFSLKPAAVVAELVSVEHAAWESTLPTELGSQLTSGRMKLTHGIATLRFRSGVTMTLEAPAMVSLSDPMEATLFEGAAVVDVPEEAIGFRLMTPDGFAVDHGTSFAIHVRGGGKGSDFHVIDGEITLHVSENGEAVRLYDQQAATIQNQEILSSTSLSEEEAPISESQRVLRIGTGGRSYSVIRANKQKWLHPDKLLMRRRGEKPHARRSFFAFDISGVDFERVQSARIRLNQVPSGIGYAVGLPEINIIGVYGLTNVTKAAWQPGVRWEDGPGSEDGLRLGQIDIPRSEQRSSRLFDDASLLLFLQQYQAGSVTFVLERETGKIKAGAPPLVHAFASDLHQEAAGPILELVLLP